MKVAIIGNGNIGTLMSATFASRGHEVSLYVDDESKFNKEILVYSNDDKFLFSGKLFLTSNNIEKVISGAEIIFIVVPAMVFKIYKDLLKPYIKSEQAICVVPGTGGAEFAFKELIDKGCPFLGFQRVHSIARLKKYGVSVYELGKKEKLFLASIPSNISEIYKNKMYDLFGIPVETLPNYLNVTFTPSNPILHTSRLFSMFSSHPIDFVYPKNFLFYEEWDDYSSNILLEMDKELEMICKSIPLDLYCVVPLRIYYENDTSEGLTKKISSIKAFNGIGSPMLKANNGYVIDKNSRYFTADFPFGLKVLIEFGHIFNVKIPVMENVYKWYCNMFSPNKQFSLIDWNKKEIINFY